VRERKLVRADKVIERSIIWNFRKAQNEFTGTSIIEMTFRNS
jgi:hypothetical protein